MAVDEIKKICSGEFVFRGGGNITFKSEQGEFSANAMAEGFRKAGMLSRLLQNGVIQPGVTGTLFWDEPESNLNPKLMGLLVQILLELSRNGLQVVLATHEYVILKWFDLLADAASKDHVVYHSLYKTGEDEGVDVTSTENFRSIDPNPIADTFEELTKEQLRRRVGELEK